MSDLTLDDKANENLIYFFADGVFNNIAVGDVLNYIVAADVHDPDIYCPTIWLNSLGYNLYGDPSISIFGQDPVYQNDVVFLLDGSGSMVSPEAGKWQAAVDATVLFYDLMKALRHPAFEDRYSSVVFRWLWPGNVDGTTTVPHGSGLNDMTVPLDISTFNPEFIPEPPYETPMGLGLQLAVGQFEMGTEESLYSDKMIILLSDGKHNKGIDPLEVLNDPEWPGAVKVFTVGLGDDDIEPETIENIADVTYGDFRISPTPREIEGFFCEILCNTSWKLQNIPVAVDGSTVIDGDRAVFIMVWDDPVSSLNFDLQPPGGGAIITPTDNPYTSTGLIVTYHEPEAGETHAFYVCENIPDELLGGWQFTNISVPLTDILLKVIQDPRVIANFEIEKMDYKTGEPIILSATITEDGKPLTGLIEVYAELFRSPAMSIGTLMAENEPVPDYPAIRPDTVDITPRRFYLSGVMKKLGIDSISKIGGPKIFLHDDGLNGDARTNDGIYTGIIEDIRYEGSYTFRFRAKGQNKNGVDFDRGETLSEYVKFEAEPGQTSFDVVSIIEDVKEHRMNATFRVIPRDFYGSYLGPFRGDIINVWTSTGKIHPDYSDNKDGSYTFTLTYPSDSIPRVSVSVGDMIVTDRLEVKPPEPPLYSFSLHSGSTIPAGNFNNNYDPAYSIGLDFDYHFSPRFSLVGLLGYNHFKAGAFMVSDTYWLNISANLKYEFVQRVPRPFINGGPGIYIPKNGSAKAGINIGLGINYPLNPKWIIELGADYHHVFTNGNNVDFSVQHIGLIYRF